MFALQTSIKAQLLSAGLGTGTKVELTCDGADEEAAMAALLEIKDGSELLFSE